MDILLDELQRARERRAAPSTEDSVRNQWHMAGLTEMLKQTRYRDLVFTRRRADDQTIAYLAEEWERPGDGEVLVARYLRGRGFVDPDGARAAFFGFHDLAEPHGAILFRIGGHETPIRFQPPAGAEAPP